MPPINYPIDFQLFKMMFPINYPLSTFNYYSIS
jgi:hypothetical protein